MTELQEKILELKNKGLSLSQIVSETGASIGVVKYTASPLFAERLKRSEIKKQAEKEFVELVKKYLPLSNSLNNLCKHLGLKGVDGYYRKINRIIKENNLSTEHFGTIKVTHSNYRRNKFTAMSNEEFFIKDSKRDGNSIIKRLIESGYKEYKCENEYCGICEWGGKPLRLQVHHINGNHCDNRIENLQLLCPNCHTQTETYGGRNRIQSNGFKISNRINEILNGRDNSFKPKNIEEIKMNISSLKEKKHCQLCGKEIIGNGDKYCSLECAQKDKHKFEVTIEQLVEDFKNLKSFSAVGRKYGVSDNAIKKRCKKIGVYDKIRQFITPRQRKIIKESNSN